MPRIWDKGAVVGNDMVRLVLAVDEQRKVGPSWLQVSKAGQWQTVGVIPWLGYMALRPPARASAPQPLQAWSSKAVGG